MLKGGHFNTFAPTVNPIVCSCRYSAATPQKFLCHDATLVSSQNHCFPLFKLCIMYVHVLHIIHFVYLHVKRASNPFYRHENGLLTRFSRPCNPFYCRKNRCCFYFVFGCKGNAIDSGYHGRIPTTLGLESGDSTPIGYGPTVQSPIVLSICMPCNRRHIKDDSMYLAYSSPRPCLM